MKQHDLLFITISFFALVIIYIGFSVYHNSVTSTISDDVNIQISPISPTFDEKTISNLKKRNNVIPNYQISPIPTSSPTVQASPSAIPTTTPIASKSGGAL